ncbi:MAG: hypothetical protein N3A38_15195 [Planctomycetota bacterium]|nr:hypothetical protein [Planctomycetota bacterium]
MAFRDSTSKKGVNMSRSGFTPQQFRALAAGKLSFLESKGFFRKPDLEESSPTMGTIVYLGKHIGFVFSFDVRDQCVDAEIVKVCNGQVKNNWEGGYSSSLLSYLVKYAGYRGGLAAMGHSPSGGTPSPSLQEMLDGWVKLLRQSGEFLLIDRPDLLPKAPPRD